MPELGAVSSWQARTYVGLPIISSGFETAAGVRGLKRIGQRLLLQSCYNLVIKFLFNESYCSMLQISLTIIVAMNAENLLSGKDGAYDGEMDVWTIDEK